MKMKLCLGSFVVIGQALLVLSQTARDKSATFRVRRRTQGTGWHMYDDLYITHSDTGRERILSSFYLDMYETPTTLQADAIPILRMALNKFLLAEFNQIYLDSENMVDSVGSEVLWYTSINREKNGRRVLDEETGIEAEMEVVITFEKEPSPSRFDLEEQIRVIMADLQNFVGNLTSHGHEDWKNVYVAYRREQSTPAPTQVPDTTDGLQGDDNGNRPRNAVENRNNSVAAIVPTTLVAASLMALVLFLLVQRRSKSRDEASKAGPTVFGPGVENDLYSMDRSLASSRSPRESISYTNSGDSVYSGVDYEQPGNATGRKGKSMLSSLTNVSAATVRASNMDSQQQDRFRTAANPGGSMQAFAEEEEGTPSSKSDQKRNLFGSERLNSPLNANSRMNDRDAMVDTSSRPINRENNYEKHEPGSTKHVLSDLENLENTRGGSRDPPPAGTAGSIYANLFSCNPVVNHDDDEKKSEYPALRTRSFLACAPTGGSILNSKAPLSRNATMDKLGNVYDINRQPVSLDDSALIRQHTRPPQRFSRSAPSSPETNSYRMPMFATLPSMRMSPGDYIDNLSQPSTPGGDLSDSLEMANYDSSGYGRYLLREDTRQGSQSGRRHTGSGVADGSLAYQSSAMEGDVNGRRHAGNNGIDGTSMYQTGAMSQDERGRRHVGNTGVDGTAMYQTDAMQQSYGNGRRHVESTGIDGSSMYQNGAMNPLEWSYKSGDLHSVGESTLSENDGEAMPREFLFGGGKRRHKSVTSPSGDQKTRVSLGQSVASNKTNGSSHASASRELINDLVWLENKIADVKQVKRNDPPAINTVDSLSYVSDDNGGGRLSISSSQDGRNDSVMSSIVCRDCYAPPGKLHIVIHSTKDGPAVHTVKPGSSLEGHIFPGDLIISVDNVDTRSYTAEQVMKMMAAKSNKERKITVLHFEGE